MKVRHVLLLSLLACMAFHARSAHALIEGKIDESETRQAIEKASADRKFSIQQAQERELLRKKNEDAFVSRMMEMRNDSPPEALKHSPGVVPASVEQEAAAIPTTNVTALVFVGLGILSIVVLAGLVWQQTRQDRINKEQRRMKLKQSLGKY